MQRAIQNRQPGRAARAILLAAAVSVSFPALAFYPFGGWDTFGTLRYAKWKLSDFDLNNDGNVTADEGREVFIESGPAGFTAAEIQAVQRSMATWEQVPTTFASFKFAGTFRDVILPGSAEDNFDTISSFFIQVTPDIDTGEDVIPDAVIVDDVSLPVLGVTLILYNIEDVFLEITGGQIISVPAGTIIDSDIIINGRVVRPFQLTGDPAPPASAPPFDLEGIMTHEIGHFLGLGHPALSNLRPEPGVIGGLLESPVLPYTINGVQRTIGTTPTMFPFNFSVQNEQGQRVDGGRDLAPDDISGVSWLYPRGSLGQANFFDVSHEARTQTRPNSGIPSIPIAGGHVVAWADQDGNPDTPRVPMFGTMTGLFTQTDNPQLEGQFRMPNLWKQVEVQGTANLFRTPNYVFTLSPLSGAFPDVADSYIRQSPSGITPDQIDSLHLDTFSADVRAEDGYITAFISEVFQETENIFDIDNRDAGTGMFWSFEQNQFVSTATGRNLASIRPGNKPMFGDPNDVCPLFITEVPPGGSGGTDTGTDTDTDNLTLGMIGNDKLRGLRDSWLLRSSLGTAAVSAYYRVAPAISSYLVENRAAFEAFRGVKLGTYWIMENLSLIAIGAAGACLLLQVARRRRALAASAALFALLAATASAQLMYQPVTDYIANSTDIVAGQVIETESYQGTHGRIYTDVTVEIADTAKGDAAKANSTLTFTVLGGKIGGLVMHASELATFRENEEVVVYLREVRDGEFAVYGGFRGKAAVSTSKGQKLLVPEAEVRTEIEKRKAAKGQKASADLPAGAVTLDDYMDFVREVVAEQEADAAKP